MAESLPLLPDKGGVCSDVRPVLREVFKQFDYLPPLALEQHRPTPQGEGGERLPDVDHWIDKYNSDCEKIWTREGELKQKYAQRISRHPLPNIYKQYPGERPPKVPWKVEQGILSRSDLIPSLVQSPQAGDSLWVKNILNRSSCDVSAVAERGPKASRGIVLHSPRASLQSISHGEVVSHHTPVATPYHVEPSRTKENILCVPPQLDFVNFTVGRLHTKKLRIVNTSKVEVRLSIRPPSSRQLDVEMVSTRGLTVTSGAAAEFRIHFRPSDVRTLRDELLVRVSTGTCISVPISCYMQPPILHIPGVASAILSCSPGTDETAALSDDCIELGARLLGDTHCVSMRFCCESEHASFFLLSEDAWLSYTLDVMTEGWIQAGPFFLRPAYWSGTVRAHAACRARSPGVHAAALRVACSTAAVRQIVVVADVVWFTTEHVTIEAHDKDYDICSDSDPGCQYYVYLGTAFPKQPLATTVQVVNHSPVSYSYYWSVRPWGVCTCEGDKGDPGGSHSGGEAEGLCAGAQETGEKENQNVPDLPKLTSSSNIRVQPACGTLSPRSSCGVHVSAPDVGSELGVQRAVLMLILKNIPKESFPAGCDPMIVKTEVVTSDELPGDKSSTREVCDVVCSQMEVWWEVVPVRFMLDPPVINLVHSKRVNALKLSMRATQLFGCEGINCFWKVPAHVVTPPCITLNPAHSCEQTFEYPLVGLPNASLEKDIFTLSSTCGSWQSQCVVSRRCPPRHLALRPARVWLGVVAPGSALEARFEVVNDTFEHMEWRAEAVHYHGTSPASCDARAACAACRARECACGALRPTRGALAHGGRAELIYCARAPMTDGCMATLITVQRTSPGKADGAEDAGASKGVEAEKRANKGLAVDKRARETSGEGKAALVACRVLAPRLVLRVLPCFGDHRTGNACEGCTIDEGPKPSTHGSVVLRPAAALTLSRRTCYRLRFTNITPIATRVKWEPALEEEILQVEFIPNEFDVSSYAQVDIQMVLEARRVCRRRLHVYRARVEHAYQPLYLIVDTAVSGLEITCEIPLGGGENTESTLVIRRMQGETSDGGKEAPSPREIFEGEDRRRARRAENICRCDNELVYIQPVKQPRPPLTEGIPSVEIVCEPPPLTRVCPCHESTKPHVQEQEETYCLQFQQLPLRTVRSRTVIISNLSALPATWSAAVRQWPRAPYQRTLDEDKWRGAVRPPGVTVHCTPCGGTLGARARRALRVQVYADCWGLYRDQIMIQIGTLEAIVLEVWVEAVGSPLQLALSLAATGGSSPILHWMSETDPERALRIKNVSRAELTVHAYVLTEHALPQNSLPFRLYLRLFDVMPVSPSVCPCITANDELQGASNASLSSSYDEEVATGIELYLAPDYGFQQDTLFKITPETRSISPGEWDTWHVSLVTSHSMVTSHLGPTPPGAVLLRTLPAVTSGEGWYRAEPPPRLVRLRRAAREPSLQLSCCEIRVYLCALDVPTDDVVRIRKHFHMKNVGNGSLSINLKTSEPWSMVFEEEHMLCNAGRLQRQRGRERQRELPVTLPPRSSMEVCVEVRVRSSEACPAPLVPPSPPTPPTLPVPPTNSGTPTLIYDEWWRTTTELLFYNEDNIFKRLPLRLELEYPRISIEPAAIDFGFVTDGDTRDSYFSVVHSSRTVSLSLTTEWRGADGFRLWPESLTLHPGQRETIHIQYTARWTGAPAEGAARVVTSRAWCGAQARARAVPTRHHIGDA